jgi:hypothetical protein
LSICSFIRGNKTSINDLYICNVIYRFPPFTGAEVHTFQKKSTTRMLELTFQQVLFLLVLLHSKLAHDYLFGFGWISRNLVPVVPWHGLSEVLKF